MMILNLGITASSSYVIFMHIFIQTRKDYHLVNLAIHMIVGLCGLAVCLGAVVFPQEISVVAGLNQLLTLNYRLHRRKQVKNSMLYWVREVWY